MLLFLFSSVVFLYFVEPSFDLPRLMLIDRGSLRVYHFLSRFAPCCWSRHWCLNFFDRAICAHHEDPSAISQSKVSFSEAQKGHSPQTTACVLAPPYQIFLFVRTRANRHSTYPCVGGAYSRNFFCSTFAVSSCSFWLPRQAFGANSSTLENTDDMKSEK